MKDLKFIRWFTLFSIKWYNQGRNAYKLKSAIQREGILFLSFKKMIKILQKGQADFITVWLRLLEISCVILVRSIEN